ncbi:MAG: hypothetical protein L0K86_08755, partial [Actinomycetia bacterium]|nr:hypothetical protein [Actinomycetes bacterium]
MRRQSECRRCRRVERWAYVDESGRGSTYVLMAVVVCPCNYAVVSSRARAQRRPGQRRLHMSKSGDRDRRSILSAMGDLDLVLVCTSTAGKEVVARTRCWEVLVPALVEIGVRRLTIERLAGAERRDRADIRRALAVCRVNGLAYDHVDPHLEPVLWYADAGAWARVKGGTWLARIRHLIVRDLEC